MATIFYSWQSDDKAARNKLSTALKRICVLLGRELTEPDRPELDSDTQGTFGSESISQTIFNKIDSCDIFVADVTPILKSEKGKLFPNPNVMIEIGYALKTKPVGTKLYIALVEDEIDIDKMPFDIRDQHLYAMPISYKPSQIVDELTKVISQMLVQSASLSTDSTDEMTPWIYVDMAATTNWADGQTIEFKIKSDETKEFFLEKIKFGDIETEPAIAIPGGSTDTRASITGKDIFPLKDRVHEMSIVVSRAKDKYEIFQEVKTSPRADGRYNIERIIPKPNGKKL